MFALERQKIILEVLDREGSVAVSKLSNLLDVTEETVRRDLEKLEKQEFLTRTHGGAVPIEASGIELSLERRKHTNPEAKERLAKEAVSYIAPGDTVFLDASTTTFFMAKAIKKMKNVTVITNSFRIIEELSNAENVRVIAIGGLVSNNQSFVGSVAEDMVERCYVASKLFFSSKGITADAGILESNEQECGIKKRMIKNSTQRIYLCDKSKVGRVGFEKLCGYTELDTIITNADFGDDFKAKFEEHKVKVIKVK